MRLIAISVFALLATAASPLLLAGAEESSAGKIGAKVEDFSLADVRGKTHRLGDWKESQVVVVAFVGVECPLVKQYAGRLVELASKYRERGVTVVAIDSNQQDSLAELTHFERTYKIAFPLLKDAGNQVADRFAAERTPEVFVLDAERTIRYRGRIDDQFTYGKQKAAAQKNYLGDAIEALLAGKEIATTQTEAIGCHIGRVLTPKADSEVTYSKQISRILNQNCVSCHRPGEIGPFTLQSYEEVVGWAEMIDEVVQDQRMPPWHADPKHGKWANDARLSDEDKKLIRAWVAAGAPEGDKKDLPEAPKFVEGWRIGQPDQIVYMADKAYKVPARGEVKYQYFVVDPGFQEDKWIKAAECRPGNRSVVHHIIVGIAPGSARGSEKGELESDWLTATAPGAAPLILPDGMAKLIPAGSKLFFQMHYTPNGEAQEDRSSIGLVFADPKEVKREVATHKAANTNFSIPPGANNHRVEATYRFEKDSVMLALFPHMHLRGKAFSYEVTYPSGEREMLLDVPNYDFAWQHAYAFTELKKMPAGTRLKCVARFDNSDENLANPDPAARVRWGDQTWEEMMIGYFDMALADQDLSKKTTRRTDEFLKSYGSGKTKLDEKLLELAEGATSDAAKFEKLGVALRTQFPQLDRMCLTTIRNDTLEVKLAVQEPALKQRIGAAGIKAGASGTAIVVAAAGKEAVTYQDLDRERAIDLKLMSRGVASSLHVPVKAGEDRATVNFWSLEKNAFPPEAVKLLEELAQAMAK